jgi:4-hydroxy-tetrahydrodipicolinate synthase
MFGGVMVPLVTPLCGESDGPHHEHHGSVCAGSVERLVTTVRPAASALIPALDTGEGWLLDELQWRDMVTLTRRFAGGLPVLAGIELPTTRQAIERAQLARWLEVSAVVVAPPFGRPGEACEPNEAELVVAHLRAIAEAAKLPVFLYDEPRLTRRQLRSQTLADTLDGYILPLANLEPELCRAMWDAPSAALQDRMHEHCAAHDLLGEQWYLGLKRELFRRGIIASDRLVNAGPGSRAAPAGTAA